MKNTQVIRSCLLEIETFRNSTQITFSSALKFWQLHLFLSYNYPARNQPLKSTPAWSKSEVYLYMVGDLFPAYLFSRHQFHAIVIFRLKSIIHIDSGSFLGLYGELNAKLKIVVPWQRPGVKWPKLRSPVDRVMVWAKVRLGLLSNSASPW